jgi:hypothetical protein
MVPAAYTITPRPQSQSASRPALGHDAYALNRGGRALTANRSTLHACRTRRARPGSSFREPSVGNARGDRVGRQHHAGDDITTQPGSPVFRQPTGWWDAQKPCRSAPAIRRIYHVRRLNSEVIALDCLRQKLLSAYGSSSRLSCESRQ